MSTIVYIGAVGRSGTTLLERTLATSPHTIALGEMVHLWDRSVRDGESCGCGVPFADCPFWTDVGRRAFGGWEGVDIDRIGADRRIVDRNRFIPFLIVPRMAPAAFRQARDRLVDVLDRLYAAIDDVASARPITGSDTGIGAGWDTGVVTGIDTGSETASDMVIVDSSKHPSYLFLLRGLPSHRLHLLHVVRDPRGVANSWARTVVRPESGDEMEQLGTARAVLRWTSHNLLFQLAGLVGVPRRHLSYERFTNDPAELGRRVDALLMSARSHVTASHQLAVDGATVELGCDHTVSGNPMRFRTGPVVIRSDDSWRGNMPRRLQLVVGAFTTPLRQLYAR
jgi:hypothetical protein